MRTLLKRKSNSFVFLKRRSGLLFSNIYKCFRALLAALLLTGFASISYAMAPPPGGADGGPQGIGAMVQSFLPLIISGLIFGFFLKSIAQRKGKMLLLQIVLMHSLMILTS